MQHTSIQLQSTLGNPKALEFSAFPINFLFSPPRFSGFLTFFYFHQETVLVIYFSFSPLSNPIFRFTCLHSEITLLLYILEAWKLKQLIISSRNLQIVNYAAVRNSFGSAPPLFQALSCSDARFCFQRFREPINRVSFEIRWSALERTWQNWG
jgi:hypothetical protein